LQEKAEIENSFYKEIEQSIIKVENSDQFTSIDRFQNILCELLVLT